MNYDPKALLPKLEAATADLPYLFRHRAMFGGFGVYANDKMTATLSNVGIGFKLSPSDHAELLRQGGVGLAYEPGQPPSKSYALVPADWHEDAAKLREWAERSAKFVTGGT
ncbi:MAG: TfoX/Sxy family protein [Fimbriimonas ginsengisoli]|uniref:TfoX/Sxy family protein n=1 Tax=Fimbriimonas ginsengisoli TaxID=1005039 RepID=A0A931PTV3_FIMGI|nr:TfoX/Sxy family protein [Fimbriimonas ginsengisoli]